MDASELAQIRAHAASRATAETDVYRGGSGSTALRDAIVEGLGEKSLRGWAEVTALLQEHGLAGRWRSLRGFGLRNED